MGVGPWRTRRCRRTRLEVAVCLRLPLTGQPSRQWRDLTLDELPSLMGPQCPDLMYSVNYLHITYLDTFLFLHPCPFTILLRLLLRK